MIVLTVVTAPRQIRQGLRPSNGGSAVQGASQPVPRHGASAVQFGQVARTGLLCFLPALKRLLLKATHRRYSHPNPSCTPSCPQGKNESALEPAFEIFRREADGSFKWVGVAETLAKAREKVIQDPSCMDYQYVVVNSATGEQTVIEPPKP